MYVHSTESEDHLLLIGCQEEMTDRPHSVVCSRGRDGTAHTHEEEEEVEEDTRREREKERRGGGGGGGGGEEEEKEGRSWRCPSKTRTPHLGCGE